MFHAFSEIRACPQALTALAVASWTRLAYTQKGETQTCATIRAGRVAVALHQTALACLIDRSSLDPLFLVR